MKGEGNMTWGEIQIESLKKMFLNKEWWSKNKSDEGKTLTIEHIYPQTPKENDWNERTSFRIWRFAFR